MQIDKNQFRVIFKISTVQSVLACTYCMAVVLIISITDKFINCMNVISYYHRFNTT